MDIKRTTGPAGTNRRPDADGISTRLACSLADRTTARLVLAAVALTLLATPAIAHRDVSEDVADVTRRLETAPGDAALLLRRADLRRALRHWDASRADFERALDLDPGLDRAWLGLGRMWLEAGDPDRALPALRTFLTRRPEDGRGLALLGRALARTGDHDGAVEALTLSIAAHLGVGASPSPEIFLERARSSVALENPTAALDGLEEGLDLLGRPVTLEIEALSIETRSGDVDSALERLDRLAARFRRPERWLVRQGALLEKMGRPVEARTAYVRAREAIERLSMSRQRTEAVAGMRRSIEVALDRLAGSGSIDVGSSR